jgi:hypothetical protein
VGGHEFAAVRGGLVGDGDVELGDLRIDDDAAVARELDDEVGAGVVLRDLLGEITVRAEAGGFHDVAERLFAPLAAVLRGLEDGGEVRRAGGQRGRGLADGLHLRADGGERVALAPHALLHGLTVAFQGGVDLRDQRLHARGDFLGHVGRHALEDVRAGLLEAEAQVGQGLVVAGLRVGLGLGVVGAQLVDGAGVRLLGFGELLLRGVPGRFRGGGPGLGVALRRALAFGHGVRFAELATQVLEQERAGLVVADGAGGLEEGDVDLDGQDDDEEGDGDVIHVS